MGTQRAHRVLPQHLIDQIDAAVGPRRRSAFLVETARAELRRRALLSFLQEETPAWRHEYHPELQAERQPGYRPSTGERTATGREALTVSTRYNPADRCPARPSGAAGATRGDGPTGSPPCDWAINIAEVYAGMRPEEAEQTEALLSKLECYAMTGVIARRDGSLKWEFARWGQTPTLADMIVAATALEHGAALLTENRKDFPIAELRTL